MLLFHLQSATTCALLLIVSCSKTGWSVEIVNILMVASTSAIALCAILKVNAKYIKHAKYHYVSPGNNLLYRFPNANDSWALQP